jgi:two-component system phosphate regulon sensor histidine kinase PhoR
VDDRELRRKAEVAELLLEAARQFGESIEPERVYERFHILLADVIPHDGLIISSYDPRDDIIRCQYAWTDDVTLDPTTLPPVSLNREGGGMQSRVIVEGEPMLFNDVPERVRSDEGVFYNVGPEGTPQRIPQSGPKAAMMTPVKHEGQVVGVVQLMTDSGVYTANQLELFDGLVTQMGAAVRTARLQEERRRAEAAEAAALAVAAEREEAARVLEAVGDGVFLLDDSGAVRLWNRAAWLMTGLSPDSVLGERLEDRIPDWSAIAPRIPVAVAVSSARTVTLPVSAGGRDLWLSFMAVRSRDGVVFAFRDMTAERQLEEERSDFVATISHELRTPMTAVYGAAQTLLRTDIVLDEEKRGMLLNMIASQAARLAQITEEVLLTTRLDRGDVQVERTPVDVAKVVRSAVEAIQAQIPVPIELDVPADVSPAYGDADRLVQVLVNLLDNAAKYGAAPVRVRAEASNGLVRILVSDAGPGVVPADRQRIFEKFYRSDPRVTRAPSGTGLGLYISRELTRRMGGRLDLASEPGAGATFVVELPRT